MLCLPKLKDSIHREPVVMIEQPFPFPPSKCSQILVFHRLGNDGSGGNCCSQPDKQSRSCVFIEASVLQPTHFFEREDQKVCRNDWVPVRNSQKKTNLRVPKTQHHPPGKEMLISVLRLSPKPGGNCQLAIGWNMLIAWGLCTDTCPVGEGAGGAC